MFHTKSNNAKKAMKDVVKKLVIPHLGNGPFMLEYVYYHGNQRKIDVANTCSIIDKFTCDAITELGLWPDDNVDFVKEVRYTWGGVDANKVGFCILNIYEI